MGTKTVKNGQYYNYIWIDSNINNQENSKYCKSLAKNYPKFAFFNKVEDGIKYFTQVKFRLIYIIVSGSVFPEFISQLKNVIYEISGIPKII